MFRPSVAPVAYGLEAGIPPLTTRCGAHVLDTVGHIAGTRLDLRGDQRTAAQKSPPLLVPALRMGPVPSVEPVGRLLVVGEVELVHLHVPALELVIRHEMHAEAD